MLALVTPIQEANASMATIAILVMVLGIGAAYALVLVIAPVLGLVSATRQYFQRRSITRYLASEASNLEYLESLSITRPVTSYHLGAHHAHHVGATTTVGSKPKPTVLTEGR